MLLCFFGGCVYLFLMVERENVMGQPFGRKLLNKVVPEQRTKCLKYEMSSS